MFGAPPWPKVAGENCWRVAELLRSRFGSMTPACAYRFSFACHSVACAACRLGLDWSASAIKASSSFE